MEEEWQIIKDYDNYSVSNFGQIKNNISGRLLKLIEDKKHYFYVNLRKDGKTKAFRIHRIVASTFIENKNNYTQINHKNKIKSDNNFTNLEWCTILYNNQSINKTTNIGCICKITNKNSYQAQLTYYKKRYFFSNIDKDKCEDWLNARRVEIKNNLNLTEI